MSQALKVGIFMTIALIVLGYLVLRIEDLNLFSKPAQRVDAVFDSVAGLDDKATVRVAGVRVGRVDGIRLEGFRAVVTLMLETPVDLRQGASARIANLGLLGDKFVVLDPGSAGFPPLAEGELLPGSAPISFDDAMTKVSSLGDSLQEAVGSITGEGAETALSRLLDNLDATTLEIRGLVADNRSQISASVGNFERFTGTLADALPELTEQLGRVLEQIETVVVENRENLSGGLAEARQATAEIRTSIDNLNTITGKIARGEGTVGKLVHSEEAHDQLVSTLDSIEAGVDTLGDTLGRIRKFKLDLGYDAYYLESLDESHAALSMTLDPQSDRFYYLQLVDDPRGRERVKSDQVTVTLPDGSTETTTTRRVTQEDKITFTAQFGFKFAETARFRAGIVESTAGLGLDYTIFDRRLWLTLDAFNFGREGDLDPQLRLTTRWHLHPNVYLLGGYDDFLEGDRESIFAGAGIRWSDDDLKYLLGSAPRF